MALTVRIAATSADGIDSEGHITLTIHYEIQVSIPTAGTDAYSVLAAVYAVAPVAYTVGSVDAPNALCQRIGPVAVREANDRQIWTCPAVYSTKPLGSSNGSGGSSPTNPYTTPLAEPWKISGSYVREDSVTTKDKDGDAIETSGTKELKAVTRPDGYDTIHLEGYTAYISLPDRRDCVYHCNEVAMWGLQPRELFLAAWQYDVRRYYDGGMQQAVYHSLVFWVKKGGWNEVFRNASLMKINPDYVAGTDPIAKRLLPILGADGTPVTEPHPIDSTGAPCEFASAPEITSEVIPEFNFLTLGFPVTLPGPFV